MLANSSDKLKYPSNIIPQRMRADYSGGKMGEDNEKSEGSQCPCQPELKYESKDMKRNKTVSRITVNTAYSKHKPKPVDKGAKSLGSCWREWLQKHQGQVTWMITFWNSQPADLFVQRSPFVMLKCTDVCRQERPSSSRLCANFVTISVEPLLYTPLFFQEPRPPSVCMWSTGVRLRHHKHVVTYEEGVIRGQVQKAKLKTFEESAQEATCVKSCRRAVLEAELFWCILQIQMTRLSVKSAKDLSSFALWHFVLK